MLSSILGRWHAAGLLMWSAVAGPGAVFEVGVEKPYTAIGQVPWESLAAGDTVLVHWRPEPYREKWVICREGEPDAPIIVRGVPGPGGELPIIDGTGATTRAQLSYWNQERSVIKIGGASVPSDTTPAHIVVENLDIRSARPPFTYRSPSGNTGSYIANASAIYVEKGTNIVIRGCILSECGNGLFVSHATRDILIDGNYIHSNGNEGSIYEHNSYTAAERITFQFNRYGPLRPNCPGNALKDRSAGLVVRYNWIEGGNRQLDLVDAEDSVALQQSALYRATHVYGNVLIEPDGAGNSQIVHYGGDSGDTDAYRKGTLHFYHNTVVSSRSGNTTLFRLSTNDEHCDARNNLFFVAAAGHRLALVDGAGRLYLTHNWFKPGYVHSHGGVTGTITNDVSNLTSADPGFLSLDRQDFRLNTNSPCRDAGTVLHPGAVTEHAPSRQYMRHRASTPRVNHMSPDMGAFEFSPFAAWQSAAFGDDAEDPTIASALLDPDDDGVMNLFEYAFSMDPRVMSTAGLPEPLIVTVGSQRHAAIRFARRPVPSELIYSIETSSDLQEWAPGPWYSDSDAMPSFGMLTEVSSSDGSTIVRFNTPLEAAPFAFLRVCVRPLESLDPLDP